MGSISRNDQDTLASGWKWATCLFALLFIVAVLSSLYDEHLKKIKNLPGNWEADPTEYGAPQCLRIETGTFGRLIFIAGDRESPTSVNNADNWFYFGNTITITGYKYEIRTELLGEDKLRCQFTHYFIPHHEVTYHRLPETQILGPIFPEGKDSPGMVSPSEMMLPPNFDPKQDFIIAPISGYVSRIASDEIGADVITIDPFPSLQGIKGNNTVLLAKKVSVNIGHIHVIQSGEGFIQKGTPIGQVPVNEGKRFNPRMKTVSYWIHLETSQGAKNLGPRSLPNSL